VSTIAASATVVFASCAARSWASWISVLSAVVCCEQADEGHDDETAPQEAGGHAPRDPVTDHRHQTPDGGAMLTDVRVADNRPWEVSAPMAGS
jgi:hypothetical protein